MRVLKIFISYSRFDTDIAKWIEKFFENFPEEFEVFRDASSIPAGQRWPTIINQQIPKCDLFVVIITETSLRSQQVRKEVAKAIEHEKPIIPCKFEDLKWEEVRWRQQGADPELTLEDYEGIEFNEYESLARDLHRRIKKIRAGERSGHEYIKVQEDNSFSVASEPVGILGEFQIVFSQASHLIGKHYYIRQKPLTIGREPAETDIDLTLDNKVIGTNLVSRTHALVSRRGDHFLIRDMSLNGTVIYSLPEGAKALSSDQIKSLDKYYESRTIRDDQIQLVDHSLFKIGSTIFLFRIKKIAQSLH